MWRMKVIAVGGERGANATQMLSFVGMQEEIPASDIRVLFHSNGFISIATSKTSP